jgi:hypothetical protein
METSKGSILVATFTSLAFESILEEAEVRKPDDRQAWSKEKLERWRAARDRIGKEQRQKELGVWMIRSTDGGVSWSARFNCLINSPQGPIQLAGDRLLYVIEWCLVMRNGRSWLGQPTPGAYGSGGPLRSGS